jgi:LysR family cys regulon transcriptional activator
VNFQQLKTICEIVDRDLTVSGAAQATYRSQSSVTRQIQQLEEELGFTIFTRNRNRLLHLSAKGKDILILARRILRDAESMHRIGRDVAQDEEGSLVIAMTHVQARYVMAPIIHDFMLRYPRVVPSLRQGNPAQCCTLVASGKADLAVCSDPRNLPDELVSLPCYALPRVVVTPARHPLLRARPLTLEALARYPLISYDEAYTGWQIIRQAFRTQGLEPTVALSAPDADVSKVYVGLGAGIAIFDAVIFDAKHDTALRCIDASHLFESSRLNVVIRRDSYLRSYAYAFMQMFSPRLTREVIDNSLLDCPADVNATGFGLSGSLPLLQSQYEKKAERATN